MTSTPNVDNLIRDLPDPESSRRFLIDLARSTDVSRINDALLSDLAAIASYSPLLATTVLQNLEYIVWLGRERIDTKVRSTEELLESLSRFSLLQINVSANIMLARFRRRELLRIYLRDIRRLATVSEITEELSNLADAIIESALRLARQELENRYGVPLETDERGRSSPAGFCVVALGKLGSKELNYASDIDLLFLYSREGSTSETGALSSITNREFFIKLAEKVVALAGGQSGEGAAYRVDMRLRPRGSIGALCLTLDETVHYYESEARPWEQQVLIRSRPVAGDMELFKHFFECVEPFVFRPEANAAESLANVRLSKRRIEDPVPPGPGYNVKLGRGGIREIEFIAQALQLAYGGRDKWLRASHTLVSLTRLAERSAIHEKQLSDLHESYDFLRRLEHRLQMEHGLQTHTVPKNGSAYLLTARRMEFDAADKFTAELERRTANVQAAFNDVFGGSEPGTQPRSVDHAQPTETTGPLQKQALERLANVSPHFASVLAALPDAENDLPTDLRAAATSTDHDLGRRMSCLRRLWSRSIVNIALEEIEGGLTIRESKDRQTELAENSIDVALAIMRDEVELRYGVERLPLSVLALGKLGGRGMDYGSDLDLVLVYDDPVETGDLSAAEIYNRAVEIFVSTLSGITRDGSLYRVDLRLRPYGKNGASANPRAVFVDYFQKTAAVWELLAFVKLRGVSATIAKETATEVCHIIYDRAREIDPDLLRGETLRIRRLLERERGTRPGEVDLKYSSGGLLDVYFATRYLQLRDRVPDDNDDRSTVHVLDRLRASGSLGPDEYDAFMLGYEFLSCLDHNIRLVTGRSRQLPRDPKSLKVITELAGFTEPKALLEFLSINRLNIRNAFERVLSSSR